jgi:threonine synthase
MPTAACTTKQINMKFYNISNPTEKVSLRQAVLRSLSQSSDLYMPENIPCMSDQFFSMLKRSGLREIAFEVSKTMFGDDIPDEVLEKIVSEAFTFSIPLKQLDSDLYVLELFHGPTLAFKDVGARFMAGIFDYLVKDEKKEITILVATSGDTGSAVANAFYNREGIKVIILYPSGKVSGIQEKQLTTTGGNITALEVEGNFDDCQRLVKSAFADKDLNNRLNLTSANSINFARLFPQSFYYFYAIAQLPEKEKTVVFSVPSGNFGNLTAGLIAKKMGLRVRNFIASTNSNHTVVDYLATGFFNPNQTQHTITNAMDVGNPSNFPRILNLYGGKHSNIACDLKGFWFTDPETRQAMVDLHQKYNYLADPHGAVAYAGLRKYMEKYNYNGIFLETAHPAKFKEEVERATNVKIVLPGVLKNILALDKKSIRIPADFKSFKSFLVKV